MAPPYDSLTTAKAAPLQAMNAYGEFAVGQ